MTNVKDLTVPILREIRDQIAATNVGLAEVRTGLTEVRGEVRETNARLEQMREELSRRIVESEVRTSTAITDLAGSVAMLTDYLRVQADLRPRVEKCEADIRDIRGKLVG